MSLNKPSKELVVDLINRTNGTTFTAAQLVFGTPVIEVDHTAPRNTKLQVNVASHPDEADAVTVFYNRLDLALLLGPKNVQIVYEDGMNGVSDLLPILNTAYDLALTMDDIEDATFSSPSPEDYPVPIIVRAKATSLVYVGQFSLDLIEEVEEPA